MKAFKGFIQEQRYCAFDILEATVCDIIPYGRCITVTHNSGFSEFWVYLDFSTHFYVVTFPTDILYINAMKGPKKFIKYLKTKLIF